VTFADRTRPLWSLAVRAQIPIIAMGIAALAWPFLRAPARIGLDPSWQVGLHLAAMSSLLHPCTTPVHIQETRRRIDRPTTASIEPP
jgi:hypothetical protein